jgi:hypothetical protein
MAAKSKIRVTSTQKWSTKSYPTTAEFRLSKRLPDNASPVMARPGMVVQDPMGAGDYGVIEFMHTNFVILRFEDGHLDVYTWPQIQLEQVQPDPAYLAVTPK